MNNFKEYEIAILVEIAWVWYMNASKVWINQSASKIQIRY